MIIGIDLGTTNSVAAYLTDGGPKLIPNALGEVLTPSVVGVDLNGNVVVGRATKELQVVHPDRCAATFKRCMGTDWKCQLGGKDFTPEKLSALVLKSLKADAEALFGHPVDRAVITVPAYFNDHQRKATLNAGRIAGFEVKRIINEPTAAAIAYGFHEANVESLLAVIDLGGGTFDVSIIEKFEGSLEVLASSGESFLGGEDFTRSICARLLESKGMHLERAEMESPHLVSRLLHQCERAKCAMTRDLTAEIRFPNAKGELSENSETTNIHREQLIQWCEPILARIELPIRRALGDARIRPHDLHEVILVGGATRMPMVAARVEELLERTPVCRLNPDEVVALGAAIVGGLIAGDKAVDDLVVVDVAPFTLGIEISKRLGMQERTGYFLPIINRNSTIPASRVERVQTTHSNQTQCKVSVYQGESRRIEQNHFLGEFMIDGIPPGPAGQSVDVRFTYDLNGILEVEATIVATGRCMQHLITNHARGLSEREIEQAVSSMQKLKSQPRIETINQLLLHRAERIYRELPQQERAMLSELLDGFETALESGDKDQIQQFRESLNSFLQRFDHGGGEPEADSTDPDHE